MMQLLSKQKNQVLLLLLCCLLFVLLIRPWELYFLNDDFLHIPMPNQWLILRGGFMRPVPNFIVLFDKWLYEKNATGFFFTTIFFHTTCVLTVYFFVKRLLETYVNEFSDSPIPFITALLFLCYPFHAEPLMWVISRGSIIATVLTLLSLLYYIKAATDNKYFIVSWMFFVVALFTYESIWSVGLLFAILSFFDIRNSRVKIWRAASMFGIMLITFIAYLIVRIWALDTIAGDGYLEVNENLSKIALLLTNLVKLAGRNFTPPFVNTNYAIAFFVVSVSVYAFIGNKIFKINKRWGWLVMLTWVAMIAGVVTASPLGIDTHYNESERYIYFASFFYCFFLAFAITVFVSKKYQLHVITSIILIFLFLFVNVQKNYRYASSITKTTLVTVAKYPAYKRAFFIDVPKRYKGSMTFRISLPEAVRWIVPQATYDSIIVVSQVESPSGLPFKSGEINWLQLAESKSWNTAIPAIINNAKTDTLTNRDVVFWFKEDGIYKVNFP